MAGDTSTDTAGGGAIGTQAAGKAAVEALDEAEDGTGVGAAEEAAAPPTSNNGAALLMLHAAARAGDIDKARAALDAGADVSMQDPWGLAALHSAALAGHTGLVTLLLEHRAFVDISSSRGQTALHLAAMENWAPVVDVLMDWSADVTLQSPYGNTALELAVQHCEGGRCEQRIRAEFTARWHRARLDMEEHRRLMEQAERVLYSMEEQLGGSPVPEDRPGTASAPTQQPSEAVGSERGAVVNEDGEESEPCSSPRTEAQSEVSAWEPGKGRKMGYWRMASATVAEMRRGCDAVSSRAWVREPPASDPYPMKGSLVATGSVLPENDPDDPDIIASFRRLRAAAEADRRREERWASRRVRKGEQEVDEDVDVVTYQQELDRVLKESTHHTREEWDQLLKRLLQTEASWDWSKVEVHERRRDEERGKTPGVFAAGKLSKKSTKAVVPVFEQDEIIGPLGGVLRRKSRFEKLYYNGRTWVLHDPLAYEFKLRAKTTELAIEPLVIDLTAGSSQNRLRYLADVRNDPLNLTELLKPPSSLPETAEGLIRPRSSMPRPRSRPRSPQGDDHDDEADLPYVSTGSILHTTSIRDFAKSLRPDQAAYSKAKKAGRSMGVPAGAGEAEAAAEAANVLLAEVMFEGWPYVFAVATKEIFPGEELMVDHGMEHWDISRFVLSRLKDVSQLGRDLLVGCKTDTEMKLVEDEPPLVFPKREPMKRAEYKATIPPRRPQLDDGEV